MVKVCDIKPQNVRNEPSSKTSQKFIKTKLIKDISAPNSKNKFYK